MSASSRPTLWPWRWSATARLTATVDLPTPPLPAPTAMMRFTPAARAAIRDVGRGLEIPYSEVDRIAKLVPFEIGITLDKALAEDEELKTLYETEDEVRGLVNLARQLEGAREIPGADRPEAVARPRGASERCR